MSTNKHTLSVLVENKPGVLARIASLFSRRGYNIDSLAVGPTEHPEVSRMTIVVNVEESPLEQVTKQLNKLVEVIKIVELDGPGSVNRELLLVKVRADAASRGAVLDAVQLFRAKVVDVVSRGRHGPGGRQRRQARRPAPRARALRHPRARAVGHGRHRTRFALDQRAPAAPRRRTGTTLGDRHREGRRLRRSPCDRHDAPPQISQQHQPKESPQWLRCSTTTTPT